MNIEKYMTKKGVKKYIYKGAYIGIDVSTGKEFRTDIRGNSKAEVKRKYAKK